MIPTGAVGDGLTGDALGGKLLDSGVTSCRAWIWGYYPPEDRGFLVD
jgi:hypothetical protein